MTADAAVEEAERQAADLIAKAKDEAEAMAEEMKDTVRKMLATGETRQGVAELLGVSVSYVRTIDVATPKKDTGDDAEQDAGETAVPVGQGDGEPENRPVEAVTSDTAAA